MTAPITLEDYDPHWPQQFEELRSRIATALGPLASAVEHVGSTAIPGLLAKPIIDCDILLRSAADFPRAASILASLGYEHQGDLGVHGRQAFRPPANAFRHHLYVCPPDSPEYRRHIAFRDHLRSFPDDAAAYALLKRKLAATFGADREAYTQAKADFIEQILGRLQLSTTEPLPRAERTIM
jgi:GrpB-like predicted nucleotidyltransferase (UPF0157 family)